MNKRFNLTIHTSTNTKYFSSAVFRKVQIQRKTVCLLFFFLVYQIGRNFFFLYKMTYVTFKKSRNIIYT